MFFSNDLSVDLDSILFRGGQGALAVIAVSCLYFSCLTLYRLYLHPLAHVPGPIQQRASGWPRIWHCYKGDRYLREADSHRKYGNVIRIAPNALTFSTASALNAIHGKGANVFKGDEFYGVLDGGPHGATSLQMVADNEAHAARRRIWNRAFPTRAHAFSMIDGLARLMVEKAKDLSLVDKLWSGPVDVSLIARWFSFDVISMIGFGKSLDLLGSDQYKWVPYNLERLSVFIYSISLEHHVRFWQWFIGTGLPTRLQWTDAIETQKYSEFVSELVTERKRRLTDDLEKSQPGKSSDVFEHLMQTGLFSDDDLQADGQLLVAAGSDANRLAICATIFYLLKNPRTLEKVLQEVRSTVSSADDITDAALGKMKYLRAYVDETMRLTPPKAASIPREVGPGGIDIDGIHVPQGATVGVSVYALHHDTDIYPDPYAFKPERWLELSNDRRMQTAFCPFFKGPRMCPGSTIAYFAIQLALFHLLYRYDIRFADEQCEIDRKWQHQKLRQRQDEYQMNDWIIGFADGPITKLEPRA